MLLNSKGSMILLWITCKRATCKLGRSTSLLFIKIHWLTVKCRIELKRSSQCCQCLHTVYPPTLRAHELFISGHRVVSFSPFLIFPFKITGKILCFLFCHGLVHTFLNVFYFTYRSLSKFSSVFPHYMTKWNWKNWVCDSHGRQLPCDRGKRGGRKNREKRRNAVRLRRDSQVYSYRVVLNNLQAWNENTCMLFPVPIVKIMCINSFIFTQHLV